MEAESMHFSKFRSDIQMISADESYNTVWQLMLLNPEKRKRETLENYFRLLYIRMLKKHVLSLTLTFLGCFGTAN